MNYYTLTILLGLIAIVNCTVVDKCPNSNAPKLDPADVQISSCPDKKCILRRKTRAEITMKFTPDDDYETLTQDIQGKILDVPLPFPGVYGTPACPYIFAEDGTTKVGCPVKKGTTYVYKNGFDILPIYPTVSVVVHWGLSAGKKDAACFEISARIK
ncbi:ecdysteroid-regulated 16 kDa protein-like [Condylostylus longicornis]|uniref:ecdysteroid-regulated 16 kDa protein-like n=1 Tax=Condylostylus longicornis TaxID=2530218 RepID=UPI00244DD255|nr:ecdysteroid-regulated 16 kDa protein-like [Condylostylus longicornis]XP_055379244.1 ecdysteroid-regulated 16 kDa protein-like [Condylostylus longicornis]